MKCGFYQFNPEFGNPEKNLETIINTLSGVNTDLAVLPELCLSGYLFLEKEEVKKMSEPVPGPSTEKLSKLSKKKDMAIVIGMAEEDNGEYYNSAVLITPDGGIHSYRKNHLFHEEKLFFNKGNTGFSVFSIKGVKVGLLVCFDHIFPEAARTLALQGAEIICHPSNLVLTGKAQITTRSRSIENKVFWILANRCGTENRGEKSLSYSGCSQISDPDGRIMIQAGEFEEGFYCVEIDPELARNKQITALCDVFKDRRTDIYLLQ